MRYFIEVAYMGTNYAGFQIQENANTVQAEVEKALAVFFQRNISLTGSSRTDAGVHALQNFFHFDYDEIIPPSVFYNLNAILPTDIVVKSIVHVQDENHARFDAGSREYKYYISPCKNPFLTNRSWYYPFKVDLELLNNAAKIILENRDFTSFAKKNSQVQTHQCTIQISHWYYHEDCLIYHVKANRFLRGMVRGLVGTMLLVGRGKISLSNFDNIIRSLNSSKANFATPAHGLFLIKVDYPFSLK